MNIIGITGSSGSGKTTLSKILNERDDVTVIDADKVVKELSVPGSEYLNAINSVFGTEILLEDGNLNRKILANKIYNDEDARKKLNSLTFKYVVDEILCRINNVKDENIRYIVIDAPLLFESGLDKYCDSVIALIADKNLKIKRICERDGIDFVTAESRLNIQQNDDYYIKKADYVIVNKENCNLVEEIDKIIGKEKK